MDQDNRESWPNRVAAGRAPLFEALDAPWPVRLFVRSPDMGRCSMIPSTRMGITSHATKPVSQ
jgi:hypothetical protein